MNILILGGAGFLGSNLVRRCLLEKKNKIMVVDSLDPRLKSTLANLKNIQRKIHFIKGDIRDAGLMERVVARNDVVYNCAAQTSHPLSLIDPFFDAQINCIGNLTVLEALRKHNKKATVIYISSSTVIGKATEEVTEAHGELPLDIYSANKGVAEKYYHIYHTVYDLKTLVLRFANIYGPYGKGYPEFGFINYFISLANHNKPITLYGDGSQERNVMYVEDATELLYQCLSHNEIFPDMYFAVHKEHYTVRRVAEEIVAVFKKGRIVIKQWPRMRKRIDVDKVHISGEKLSRTLRWKPVYSLREGLQRTKEIIDTTEC